MYWLLFNQHYQHRTNQKLRSWANAVFQNRGVCGQAFPSLPSPSPSFFFFLLSSQCSRRTHVETLAMQATALHKLEIYCFPNFYSEKNEITDVYCLKKWRHFTVSSSHKLAQGKKNIQRKDFGAVYINRNMSKRCTVELSVERQVRLFWKVANRTVRTESLLLLFTSVQVLFFVLNTIQLYNELRSIKPKGGFYTHVVFNWTYQVLTKFHKVRAKG